MDFKTALLEAARACKENPSQNFKELYLLSERLINKIISSYSLKIQDHEDLKQEIAIKLFKSISTIKEPKVYKSWLNSLISNTIYDFFRKKYKGIKTRPFKTYDSDSKNPTCETEFIADSRQTPDEAFEITETKAKLLECLDLLNCDFKHAFELVAIQDLTYKQAAEAMNVNLGTLKSRYGRGKAKIQELMQAA